MGRVVRRIPASQQRRYLQGGGVPPADLGRREAAAARAGGSGMGKEEALEPDEEPELRRWKAPVAIGSAENKAQRSRRTAAAA
jgi:hypothetical protein